MTRVPYRVHQTTNGADVSDVYSGSYEEPGIRIDQIPTFNIEVSNKTGVNSNLLREGKEIEIFRNGVPRFVGVIHTSHPKRGDSKTLTIRGVHKGYRLLQSRICDGYDFDEDGDPGTTRDAVTVNPWKYLIFRDPFGELETNGLLPSVDGVDQAEAAACLVGTKFIVQHDFVDNSKFLASGAFTSNLQVYLDGELGDGRPALQRVRDSENFTSSTGSVESIPLENGDPNIDVMGNASSATILLIGKASTVAADTPSVQMCNNARDAVRGYQTVTLSKTASYRGTTLDAWSGSIKFNSQSKNSIGYKITFPGASAGAQTTRIYYLKIIANTTSDTGIGFSPEIIDTLAYTGTVDTFVIPDGSVTRRSQSFLVDSDSNIDVNRITFRMKKVGSPSGAAFVRLSTLRDSGGVVGQVQMVDVTTAYAEFEVSLGDVALIAGATYYVTWDLPSGDASNYVVIDGSTTDTYDNGSAWEQDTQQNTQFENYDISVKVFNVPDDPDDRFVETDFLDMTRLEALERLRLLTEAREAVNPSPHFDAIVTNDLNLEWRERRGSDLAKQYSVDGRDIVELGHEFFGGELAFQTVAYGPGSGDTQTRIVSKAEFSLGGLYDSANDPGSGNAYGSLPRILKFIDQNEQSAVSLLKKARAFHKLRRSPRETITLDMAPMQMVEFEVGDRISLKDVWTRTNGQIRVTGVKRSWSGDRERMVVELGDEPEEDFIEAAAKGNRDVAILTTRPTPRVNIVNQGGAPIHFDKTNYGVYVFRIDDGSKVKRVKLQMTTQPWIVTNGVSGTTMFKGDDGIGNPVYATKVQFQVDGPVGSDGLPSAFTSNKNPNVFGKATEGMMIAPDVTGSLNTDANGVINSGEHRVFLRTDADATNNNTNGLAAVSISEIIEVED